MIIKKGGILETDVWRYEKIKADRDPNYEGSYETVDLKEDLLDNLFESVTLEDGVTIRDILSILSLKLDILKPILQNNVEELVTKALATPVQAIELTKEDAIEYVEITKYLESSSIAGEVITSLACHVSGRGIELDKDSDWGPKGSRVNYSLSFTSIEELANLPVKLNPVMEVWNDTTDYEGPEDAVPKYINNKVIDMPNPTITLLELFRELTWEFSFYGDEDSKKEHGQMLKDRMDEVSKSSED